MLNRKSKSVALRSFGVAVAKDGNRSLSPPRVGLKNVVSGIGHPSVTLFAVPMRSVDRLPTSLQKSEEAFSLWKRLSLESSQEAPGILSHGSRRWMNVTSKATDLRLTFGTSILPHPSKAATGGEDAVFVGNSIAGVADGVGGWSLCNINSGLFSRELLNLTHKYLSEDDSMDLKAALEKAVSVINSEQGPAKIIGSSTACIIRLRGTLLQAINLGDSGFIVIRKPKNFSPPHVVMRSIPQQHGFNFPFQIGFQSKDQPSDADSYHMTVREGDCIVVASDGVFDNLFDEQILREMFNSGAQTPQERADRIATAARAVSLGGRKTPFGVQARIGGYAKSDVVGKMDDIGVVVAEVVSS